MKKNRGQMSLEMLLVVAFSILLSLVIGLPYLESQAKTNASINTKLAILAVLEQNTKLAKITSIQPEITGSDLKMTVNSKGTLNAGLVNQAVCYSICKQIDLTGFYQTVTFEWVHNQTISLCPSTSPPNFCP